MKNTVQPVDWAKIYSTPFVVENQCWTTCGGGACCKSDVHPDFKFQLLPNGGAPIVYLEEEYAWVKKHRKAPMADHGGEPDIISFDFGGPKPLRLVSMVCRLLGRCDGVIDKPVLCRVYPMMPLLSLNGDLEEIIDSSIFELTMRLKGFKTPCTVTAKKDAYFEKWKNSAVLESLRHPYIIFHLKAVKYFSDTYSEKLMSHPRLQGLTGKEFWKTWELLYLGKKLVDADLLASQMKATYDELKGHYGDFF